MVERKKTTTITPHLIINPQPILRMTQFAHHLKDVLETNSDFANIQQVYIKETGNDSVNDPSLYELSRRLYVSFKQP